MQKLLKILLPAVFLFPLLTFGQFRPVEGKLPDQAGERSAPEEKEIPSRVLSWKIRNFGAFTDSVKIDTLWHNYHNYHPAYKQNISNTYTGNYGGSYLSNDFRRRNYHTDFYLLRGHDAYILTPSQIDYYNTTTPYTILDYSQSENKNRNNETRFNVLHSQNVTPHLNVTFRYDQAKSDGQYNFQQHKNHFITLYSSYTSDKADVYGGVIFNRVFNTENGGTANDEDLLNTETKYVVMRLTDATSAYFNNTYFANGEYRLGVTDTTDEAGRFRPVAGILYSFVYSGNQRMFREGKDQNNSTFFPVSYLGSDITNDSVRFTSVTNLLQLKFYESARKRYSFGQRVFAGVDIVRNSYAAPGYQDAVFPFHDGDFQGARYQGPFPRWYQQTWPNAFIGGGIFRELGKFWNWNFDGRQFVTGYKAGQTELNGTITKPVRLLGDSLSSIRITGNLWNRVPDYFQQRYFSNRRMWNNDFANEQLMNFSFTWLSPGHQMDAGASYALINNFIYHDTTGIPAQTKNEMLVLSAWINKEFKLSNFTLITHLLWQKASAPRYLHLPDLSARVSLSYELLVSKVLHMQLGTDIRYNTLYYADAYDPATGFFYLQNEKQLGNYPHIDGFANFKLKRTRLFAQYMNAGSLFMNKSYFTALHQPMNQGTFRLGVAWSFYN